MFLLLCGLSVSAEEVADQQVCAQSLQPSREVMLKKLDSVERTFVEMKWNFTKYREITYKPLWEAKQMMQDQLSIGRSAEGEVLFNRYQHNAEVYQNRAEEFASFIFERLDEMKREIYTFNQVCSAWGFLDCFEMWNDRFKVRLKELEIFLRDHIGAQRRLNEQVADALYDNPSEHHEYGDRFVEYFSDWERLDLPNFLVLMRSIQEKLEYSWPGEKCCLYCEEGAVYYAETAIKNVLKADPEASFGVRGNVVGKTNLNEAFEEMYTRSEEELGEDSEES